MRKKFLLLAVLAAALLLLAGTALAETAVPEHDHWAYCTSPNVCAVCGEAYAGNNINHTYETDKWQSDETSHWLVCPDCQQIIEKAEHQARCGYPTFCWTCLAPYSGSNIYHPYDWEHYESDGTNHWHVCSDCGKTLYPGVHWSYCDNPTVCAECGATYTGNNIRHKYAWDDWQSDETTHWHVCTLCHEAVDRIEHIALCNAPGVCADCGAAYTGSNIQHIYNWENWQSDDTAHWHVCTECGTITDRFEHWAYCNDPNVCAYCGADYAGSDISHTCDWSVWYSDETSHWHLCTECGAQVEKSEHWADCSNPTVCVECGAPYTGSDIRHSYDWDTWHTDETSHWYECTGCGKVWGDKTAHWATCDAPEVCAECGAAYTGSNISHTYDWENWESDETHHWHVCTKCGEITEYYEHFAWCDAPGVCLTCGAEYPDMPISHQGTKEWKHDETNHWKECPRCGDILSLEEHVATCDAPNVCIYCGVDYAGSNIWHTYDWDAWQSDETSHWHICDLCGEIADKSEHFAFCTSPDVCAECGAPCAGSEIHHFFDWDHLDYDEDCHWRVCTECGAAEGKTTHFVYCTAPNVCAECGAPCSGIEPWHNYDYENIISEGKYHWWICLDCGKEVYKSRHYAVCTDPHHCAECGADYDGSDISHNYDWENVLSDDTHHWRICLDCGEIVGKSTHSASCMKPTVCSVCGKPYSGNNINHYINWNKPQHDETYHWYVCLDCGETVNQYEHWAYCDTPNVCAECGAAYSGSNVQHDWYWDDAQADETSHWWICERCGEVDNKGMHYALCDKPGICAACGRPYTGSDVRHYTDEDSVFSYDASNHWTVCVLCGETWTMQHDFDEDGVCYVCGYEMVHEHTWQVTAETAPTCTEDGSATYTCSVCGETKTETLPNLGGHAWQLTASKSATCTEDGSATYACSVCGETKTETIASPGHTWVLTASKSATCTEDGSETYTCSVCGETKTETITSPGHTWVLTASKAVTCTEDGSETYTCSVCGETKTETLPNPGGHDWQLTASKPVTCTEDGFETYTCSLCGETKTETLPNPGGHNWQLIASTPATCMEDGCAAYTCSICGETNMEALSRLGHDWKQDETRPATCKEGASVLMTCSRCGIWTLEYTSEPLVHELKPVETKDATCTAPGSILSRCDNCGETATEIIPALGHAYSAYAPAENNSHTATCSRCGMKLSKPCQMKETKLGALTYSICSVCGRTVMQTPAAPAETAAPAKTAAPAESAAPAETASAAATATPAPTPTPAPVEVKVIENAVIEAVPADNAASEAKPETVVPKEAVLVVLDCSTIVSAPAKTKAAEAAEPVENAEATKAPEDVAPAEEAAPALSAFTVSLVVEGEEVELTSAVKVRIPLTEETAPSDLTGLKLVLILPNGETVDVEFEIVDGELVFTTDMLGMFAFVPVEE